MGCSVMSGIAIYGFLYWWLIPSLHYSKPIYFDYTIDPYPRAMINIASEQEYYLFNLPFSSFFIFNTKQSSNLISNQLYDIQISLDVPNKAPMTNNIDVGNFNIKLSLYSCQAQSHAKTSLETDKKLKKTMFDSDFELNDFIDKYDLTLVKHIQRPISIKYESTIVSMFKKTIFLIPYAIGWFQDEQNVLIPMMKKYKESSVKFFFLFFCLLAFLLCFAIILRLSLRKKYIFLATFFVGNCFAIVC